MLALGLQAHQVDDVHDPHLQLGQALAQDRGRGERLERRHVTAAAEHDVGLVALVGRRPVPDPETTRAVRDRVLDREVGERGLLARDDDVDVVPAAQAVVGDGEERVGVRRQVDADHLGLLVHDVVDEPRVLVREAVVVLAPDVRAEEVVERGDGPAPRDLRRRLQPLRMLVEHRVDDVDERLVAREQPVPPGEQVPLEPALAEVLGEDLHHAAVRREPLVGRRRLRDPGPPGHAEDVAEPVRGGLVGPEEPERLRVPLDHVTQVAAQDAGRLGRLGARPGHVDRVVAEVGQHEVPEQLPAVGVRVGAHPQAAGRRELPELGHDATLLVEELLGPVAPKPLLELPQVVGVVPDARERDLVRAPGALHGLAVDLPRPRPALGRPQDDHRPARAPGRGSLAGLPLDTGDRVERPVERGGEPLVDMPPGPRRRSRR